MKEKGLSVVKNAAGRVAPVLRRYSWTLAVLLAGVLLLASGSSCSGGQEPKGDTESVVKGFDLDAFEE